MPILALNLFDLKNQENYLRYAKLASKELAGRGAKVVKIGRSIKSLGGDVEPRQVMILVEWPSQERFDSYLYDISLDELHWLRENGTKNYVWQSFEQMDDLSFIKQLSPQP